MNHDALLQAIRDAPDDDTLRLIYADWLDDHGNCPRADFIRAQCEQANLPEDSPRAQELGARAMALLGEHLPEWLGSLGEQTSGWVFRRGFVESCAVEAACFQDHAELLFRCWPVRFLHFRGPRAALLGDAEVRDLARSPWLARLTGLSIRHTGDLLGAESAAALAECPFLTHLRELDLNAIEPGGPGIGPAGVRLLASSPHLSGLTTLRLGWHVIGDGGLRALATGSLRSLECLDLLMPEATPDGFAELLRSPNLSSLRELRLASARLGREGTQALVESPFLHRLASLSVDQAHEVDLDLLAEADLLDRLTDLELPPGDVTDILASPRLRNLVRLRRSSCPWNDENLEWVEVLTESSHLRGLTALDLFDVGLSPEGLRLLIKALYLTGLRKLDLWFNQLDNDSLVELAGSALLSRLVHLNMRYGDFSAEGVAALANSPNARQLRSLYLSGSKNVGDAGLRALAASPHLRGLQELELTGVGCTDAGVEAVTEAPWPCLTKLELSDNLGDLAGRTLARVTGWPLLSRLALVSNNMSREVLELLQERWGPRLETESQDEWR